MTKKEKLHKLVELDLVRPKATEVTVRTGLSVAVFLNWLEGTSGPETNRKMEILLKGENV
jgi:hypothetical protein